MNVVCIIPARGGSKGIPKKNIKMFCGKPLIAWTIENALHTKGISSVWVSSDDQEILSIAAKYGAKQIVRPENLSGDTATSESAWLHAIEEIEKTGERIDIVVAPQLTSPLRESKDFENGLQLFLSENLDSMFTGAKLEGFFTWEKDSNNQLKSINYDYQNRKRRQEIGVIRYVENGSFYIFKPEIIKQYNNRLGGKIGVYPMDFWKTFELDSPEDWKLCEILMKGYLLNEN